MASDQTAEATDTTSPQEANSNTTLLGVLTLLGGIAWLAYAFTRPISTGEYVNQGMMLEKIVHTMASTAVVILGGVLTGAGQVIDALRRHRPS